MPSKALFEVPPGAVAQVSITDSSFRLSDMGAKYLMIPEIEGLEKLPTMTTWSFLVESSDNRKAMLDLGVPPDIQQFPPLIVKKLQSSGWNVKSEKNVAEILSENGTDLKEIKSVISSHWHWDHIGDVTTFPSTTELVVGPGFKSTFLPGYPANPASPVREADFEGRTVREIDFASSGSPVKAGQFRAFDFFGDGSFFLLDTPGHAIGHLSGLARTSTNPESFIFMGGDLCHHGGELRPSSHLPLPSKIPLSAADLLRAQVSTCPGGELFAKLHGKHGRAADEPLFLPAIGADIPLAIETIQQAQEADAQEDVFFIFAHDTTIGSVVDQYPLKANEWKRKGWREKTLWSFLSDLIQATTRL